MRLMFALCFVPLAAQAQNVDCANASTQQEMNYCAEQEWLVADSALNGVYSIAMDVMTQSDAEYAPEGKSEADRLRTAQRAWLAYRDAACDSAGFSMRGGSAEPLLIYGCMRELTEQRTAMLELMVDGY